MKKTKLMKYYCPLVPGQVYHVFNHAVGSEILFRQPENYSYFLLLMEKYFHPVAEIYAYNLLPNHFHLLLKIKSSEELMPLFRKKYIKKFPSEKIWHKIVMQCFSNFLNAYAKAYNKRYERKGALFLDYLKRSAIPKEQICDWIHFIHYNAVHHKIVQDLNDWPWSSYYPIIMNQPSSLENRVVFQHFQEKHEFIQFHKNIPSFNEEIAESI